MKNKFNKHLVIIVLIAIVLSVVIFNKEAKAENYANSFINDYVMVTNTTYLNFRDAPDVSGTWLGRYPNGTWLKCQNAINGWCNVVTPDGKVGYMSGNFLTSGLEYGIQNVAIVNNPNNSKFLNFREYMNYNSKVLGIFFNGVPLRVSNSNNGWYAVSINGNDGYIRSEYAQLRTMYASDAVATIKTPNNSKLNMRSGPGMQYSVISRFSGDRYLMVLAKGTQWWRVSIDGIVGFMSSDFLKLGLNTEEDINANTSTIGGPGSNNSTISSEGYGIVNNPKTTQVLNLRQMPTTASNVLSQYRNGVRFTVVQQGSEWCKVKLDTMGLEGYFMTKYIKLYNLPSIPYKKITHPDKTYVNLRQAPSLSQGQIITKMPHGSIVEILYEKSGWAKIRYNGIIGYAVTYFMQ